MTSTSTRARYNIDAVKAAADLAAEVTDRTGQTPKRKGNRLTFPCPNPSHADAHPSFTVNEATGRWRCWSRCDRSGDVIELVKWLDGLDTADALAYLADKYRVPAEVPGREWKRRNSRPKARAVPVTPTPRLVVQAEDTCRPWSDEAEAVSFLQDFLRLRGWTEEVARDAGLHLVMDSRGKPRVRFPFRRNGRVMVWQDRALGRDVTPKWLTPAGATLYPFGLELLEALDGPPDRWPSCPVVRTPAVWLVEGPADAVTLRSVFPGIIALGLAGSGAWQAHYVEALQGLAVVVVADNDEAGRKLRATITESIGSAALVVNVEVPDDFGDLGEWHLGRRETFPEELQELADAALEAALMPYAGTSGEVAP